MTWAESNLWACKWFCRQAAKDPEHEVRHLTMALEAWMYYVYWRS